MLLKNLRPADEYDRFAAQALEPWDVMFVTRIRQIARDLPPGALVDIGTATVVVPVRLAADPVLKGWHFIGLDLDETMQEARELVIEAGLEHCTVVTSPRSGMGALGFEILIKKPLLV